MKINLKIEHTLLDPNAKKRDIQRLCFEAVEYNFRSIVVNPEWVHEARMQLTKFGDRERKIKIVQVLNFPTTKSKQVCKESNEIDLLLGFVGIGNVKNKRLVYQSVEDNVEQWLIKLEQVGKDRKDIKIIIETRLLTPKEIKIVCRILKRRKVGYIKSSTGLYKRNNKRTNMDDLRLIKKAIRLPVVISKRVYPFRRLKPNRKSLKLTKFLFRLRMFYINIPYKLSFYKPGIKIAGGIRTYKDAKQLIENGSDILGCSKSVSIIKEVKDDR